MSRSVLASLLVLLVSGCSQPRVVPIIGPDGSSMLHVSCGDHEGECYRLAGEHCPYGYDVGRTISGTGNMLVRCRAPQAQPAYPATYPAYAGYGASPASTSTAPAYAAAPAPTASAAEPVAAPAPSASASAVSPAPAKSDSEPFDVGY